MKIGQIRLVHGIFSNICLSLVFSLLISIFSLVFAIFNNDLTMLKAIFIQNLIRLLLSICIFFIFISIQNDNKRKIFDSLKVDFKSTCCLLICFITIYLISHSSNEFKTPLSLIVISGAMFLTGISEELIYRVIAMNCYENYSWTVIICQALVFAIIGHGIFNNFQTNILLRFPLGILLGVVYKVTHRFWYGAYLHGLYDTIIFAGFF